MRREPGPLHATLAANGEAHRCDGSCQETEPILAADYWPTNGDLIREVADLYFPPEPMAVIDLTYGRGTWWSKYRPINLVTNDLDPETEADFNFDFTGTKFQSNVAEVVAYDPPYVSVGGRKTSTLKDYHARYGLTDAPTTPASLQSLINAGLSEATRVAKVGGLILVKCQDYISSGRFWPGTHLTLTHALDSGLEIVDRFEHLSKKPRPQPPGRRQIHSRRNLSTLFILRKREEREPGER